MKTDWKTKSLGEFQKEEEERILDWSRRLGWSACWALRLQLDYHRGPERQTLRWLRRRRAGREAGRGLRMPPWRFVADLALRTGSGPQKLQACTAREFGGKPPL